MNMKPVLSFVLCLVWLLLQGPALAAPFPAGSDSFAGATVVPPEGGSAAATDLNTCTGQAGEPAVFTDASPKTAWWKWTAPESSLCVLDTLSLSFNSSVAAEDSATIAVFTGSSLSGLSLVARSSIYTVMTSDSFPDPGAALSFYAEKGKTYHIQVGSQYVWDSHRTVVLTASPLPTTSVQKMGYTPYTNPDGTTGLAGTSVLVNSKGSYTGKLQLRSGTYTFKGALDFAGYGTAVVALRSAPGQPQQPPATLVFRGTLTGKARLYLPNCPMVRFDLYDRIPVSSVPAGPWSGVARFSSLELSGPVMMTVRPNNTVVFAMKSADGSALTYSGPFYHGIYSNARPSINLLKFLNGGKTAIAFDLAIIDGAGLNRPLTGSGWHLKDAQPSAVLYPGGLGALFSFSGKPYVRPGAGTRAHDFLNASGGAGKLRVTDPTGELGGTVDLPLTFDTNNKFVFATDLVRKPSLKLNLATGQITGSITLNGRKRNMVGSLFMSLSTPRLQGYITGTTRNVGFEVIP